MFAEKSGRLDSCQDCGSENWFNWRVYAPNATDEIVELDSLGG